ncbi:hypothetical protein EG827_00460 [bacterium]|nr:hypothetical protein [bacterium]
MKKIIVLMILTALAASCRERGNDRKGAAGTAGQESSAATQLPAGADLPAGAVLIASNIVTEVIIKPDPEGDPWEIEKVAGYQGESLVNNIFDRIYDGTLTVFDYHSGEPLSASDVKSIEKEFSNDRTKIGKLSFTEDWYYDSSKNSLHKKARSVTFGYELYNNMGKVYAYRAAFRADLN